MDNRYITLRECEDYEIATTFPFELRNKNTGRILLGTYDKGDGYIKTKLKVDGKSKRFQKHRLIYNNLVAEIPKNFEIDHINCKKDDNRLENLRCVSRRVNQINKLLPGEEFAFIDTNTTVLHKFDEDIYYDNNKKFYRHIYENKYKSLVLHYQSPKYIRIRYRDNDGKFVQRNVYDIINSQ